MNPVPSFPRLSFAAGVTLVGGGGGDRASFDLAVARAPHVVAADGGADRLAGWGAAPEAVVGDLDSLADPDDWARRLGPRLIRIAEQETTDFEKCLYTVEAPFYLGVGFTGRRFDHTLAALHALARRPSTRAVLIGEEDVVFLAPPRWRASLAPGARVSFFPLASVSGLSSEGLRWPVDGLEFAPGARIGTSNRADAQHVAADFSGPGMACILDRAHLDAALESLGIDP